MGDVSPAVWREHPGGRTCRVLKMTGRDGTVDSQLLKRLPAQPERSPGLRLPRGKMGGSVPVRRHCCADRGQCAAGTDTAPALGGVAGHSCHGCQDGARCAQGDRASHGAPGEEGLRPSQPSRLPHRPAPAFRLKPRAGPHFRRQPPGQRRGKRPTRLQEQGCSLPCCPGRSGQAVSSSTWWWPCRSGSCNP